MSIIVKLGTPLKEETADLMQAISDIIRASVNKTVTVEMSVTFNQDKKKKDA